MSGLIHAHSGLRYVVLALLLLAIFKAFSKAEYKEGSRKINLFALISTHIQVLLGLALYFTSEKVQFAEGFMSNTFMRFFAVEHIFGMILAAVLITIGHSKSKKAEGSDAKNKKIAVFYTIALIVIFASIPWPFREGLSNNWF